MMNEKKMTISEACRSVREHAEKMRRLEKEYNEKMYKELEDMMSREEMSTIKNEQYEILSKTCTGVYKKGWNDAVKAIKMIFHIDLDESWMLEL